MLETVLKDLINKKDVASLDAVSTLLYTLGCISKSGHEKCGDILARVLRKVVDYNLSLKHDLTENERKEKLKILDKLYLQGFVSYQHREELLSSLEEVAKDTLQNYAEERLENLDETEKKVLSFVLYCRPKFAEERERYFSFGGSFGHKLQQMTVIFNRMFDETLLARNALERELHPELPFWEIGDMVVRAEIGYWIPYVSSSCYVYLDLIIPKFLFEILERNRHLLPKIENFDERFKEIQEKLKDADIGKEIHSIFLAKVKDEVEMRIKEYKLPKIREPRCENDLYFLIGRYWDVIREKTGLEDIVFVDKHWDAEGVYKGRKVRIEIKVDAEDFDKDPTQIDLLLCWKITPSGSIAKQTFEMFESEYVRRGKVYKREKIWVYDYDVSKESKECLKRLRSQREISKDLVKEIFRCVGIEVLELSEILKDI